MMVFKHDTARRFMSGLRTGLGAVAATGLLAGILVGGSVSTASAGGLPECGSARLHAKIMSRFAWADRKTWHRDLDIVTIDRDRQSALRHTGERRITTRYCRARAVLSNGRKSRIYYIVQRRMGFASIGYNVEFCLPGYDRWRVYDGWCRVVRPQ